MISSLLAASGGLVMGMQMYKRVAKLTGPSWMSAARQRWETITPLRRPTAVASGQDDTGKNRHAAQHAALHGAGHALYDASDATYASVSLALSALGTLFFLPLNLLCVPLLVYLGIPLFRNASHALLRKGRATTSVFDALVLGLCVATGSLFAASLSIWFYHYRQRRLRLVREQGTRVQCKNAAWNNAIWIQPEGAVWNIPPDALTAQDVVIIEAGDCIPVNGVMVDGLALVAERDLRSTAPSARSTIKEAGDTVCTPALLLAGRAHVRARPVAGATWPDRVQPCLAPEPKTEPTEWAQQPEESHPLALTVLGVAALAALVSGPQGAAAIFAARPESDVDRVTEGMLRRYIVRALRRGMVIHDSRVFQRLQQINTVVIDVAAAHHPEMRLIFGKLRQRGVKHLFILAEAESRATRRLVRALQADGLFIGPSLIEQADVIEQLHGTGSRICYIYAGGQAMNSALPVEVLIALDQPCPAAAAQVVLPRVSLDELIWLFDAAHSLYTHTRQQRALTLTPAALAMASALFLQTGPVTSILANNLSFLGGLHLSAKRLEAAE